jgi:DNA-binding NarL/FixJ family response regulator
MESNRLRVFLADEHPVVRHGVKALIAADCELELVGEAADGSAALELAIELRPDVAVLDLLMPGMNGIEVARQLLAACPRCRVVVLTIQEDAATLRQVLALGIAGYVLKRSATDELVRSIHAAAAGGIYLDPAIAGRAVGTGVAHVPSDLSTRESEVLRLTAAGYSIKAIATKLAIGAKTVDTYKTRAMAKLGFRSRVDVVKFAMSKGWMTDT